MGSKWPCGSVRGLHHTSSWLASADHSRDVSPINFSISSTISLDQRGWTEDIWMNLCTDARFMCCCIVLIIWAGEEFFLWVRRELLCCSVLQCVLQYVALSCSGLQSLQCVAIRCSVLQCVAARWSVLQCVAVCCSVLHWVQGPLSKEGVSWVCKSTLLLALWACRDVVRSSCSSAIV